MRHLVLHHAGDPTVASIGDQFLLGPSLSRILVNLERRSLVERSANEHDQRSALLTLSGERELAEKDEGETYHRIERSYGKFSRSFTLPSQVDNSKVEASFNDGLLTIEVLKSEQAQPRKIEIK